MTVDEYTRELERSLSGFIAQFPKLGQEVGNNAKALIERRVVGQGIDHQGRPFSGYSDRPYPTYVNRNRLGKGAYAALVGKAKQSQKARGGLYSSYKDVREAAGRQTSKKDFRFTGEMWRNTLPVTKADRNGFRTLIEGRSDLTKKKLQGHADREGGDRLLNLSQSEEQSISKVIDRALDQALKPVK